MDKNPDRTHCSKCGVKFSFCNCAVVHGDKWLCLQKCSPEETARELSTKTTLF